MPWQVSAFASDEHGRRFKEVINTDDGDEVEDVMELLPYWVRNMDPGELVVIVRV